MQRAGIGTNVLVSAMRSRSGASSRLISLLGDPRWRPIVSVALILEYEEVAKREASRLGLADWVVESIVDMFCRLGSQPAIRFRLRPALRDPGDEFLLELAATGAGQKSWLPTNTSPSRNSSPRPYRNSSRALPIWGAVVSGQGLQGSERHSIRFQTLSPNLTTDCRGPHTKAS
ncbi:MAG: PIN domain-containing protein [Acidobacteriia bacterium]|nr:PIN domain-containing protein [Terriglobia bacterium]